MKIITNLPFKSLTRLYLVIVISLGYINATQEKTEGHGILNPKGLVRKSSKFHNNLIRKAIPILCYHALRNIRKDDNAEQKTYSVSPATFAAQIKALADNGYSSITPDELKNYYTYHKPLPEKPIMITFDDGREEQFTLGAQILEKYHFRGVFFIMTVTIGKLHYMNANEIKALSNKGHTIGCHTWNHTMVTHYSKNDWTLQLEKPKKQLEKITKKRVTCFAYPYGVWNLAAVDALKRHGFSTAFIIYGQQDVRRPLFTLKRTIVTNINYLPDFLGLIKK